MERRRMEGWRIMTRRNERLARLALLAAILLFMAASTSFIMSERPAHDTGPSASEIGYVKNLYRISGYRGEVKEFLEIWPEYADYIIGK